MKNLPPFYAQLANLKSLDPDIERIHIALRDQAIQFRFQLFKVGATVEHLEFSIGITEAEMEEMCSALGPEEILEGAADRKLIERVESKFREIVRGR